MEKFCSKCNKERGEEIKDWYYSIGVNHGTSTMDPGLDYQEPDMCPVLCQECYQELSEWEKHRWRPIK